MSSDFDSIFKTVRGHFRQHEPNCVVLHDEPGRYYLGTHEVRGKDGYRTWLGGVEIKKAQVSVHLIPVYVYPDMLDGVSTGLRKRMQGKSCFNFKKRDAALLDELGTLIDASVARFERDGRI